MGDWDSTISISAVSCQHSACNLSLVPTIIDMYYLVSWGHILDSLFFDWAKTSAVAKLNQMKKEKWSVTKNKEEDSHCRKAAVLQLNILLYNSRLQITILNSQPLVSAQNENPSECLPSVTAHWAPAGLHLLLCRYSITTQPQPQLASTGLRFLVIGHQTFAGEGSGSVESVDTVGLACLKHTFCRNCDALH